jgi:hypothetical protein
MGHRPRAEYRKATNSENRAPKCDAGGQNDRGIPRTCSAAEDMRRLVVRLRAAVALIRVVSVPVVGSVVPMLCIRRGKL